MTTIDTAFILAAGRGNRLRPHTDTLPKPMVPVAGKPIIDHVIAGVVRAGVRRVTVNTHYMADKLQRHIAAKTAPQFTISAEDVLMDTGGGIKKALPTLGEGPFFVVSGDSFWDDGASGDTLRRMAAAWDPARMDLLLLLQPVNRLHTAHVTGDYDIAADGRAVRSHAQTGRYMWTSIRVCDSRLFADTPDTPFSFLTLMDRAEAAGRLYALVHDGAWYHITTPDDLTQIDTLLRTPVTA